MTKLEILSLVRKFISDEQATGFTDGGNLEEPEGTNELLSYLDRAVDEYSKRQANNKDIRLIKRMTFSNGSRLPDNFISFCGVVPLIIEGSIVNFYGEESSIPVRYFARLPYVTGYNDEDVLPHENDQLISIAALAAIYALNKHEFNVSQDLLLLGYGSGNNGGSE